MEHKLFIGRVPSTVEEEEIKQIFSGYGEVEEVTILHDAAGNSKNCGFVRLKNRAQANAAIAGLNEIYQFPGTSNRMVVKFADTAKQKEMRKRQAMQQVRSVTLSAFVRLIGVLRHRLCSPIRTCIRMSQLLGQTQ